MTTTLKDKMQALSEQRRQKQLCFLSSAILEPAEIPI
jgi:hypothetical protein